MRILMMNRLAAPGVSGGDSIQMMNTRCALEQMGVKVDIGPAHGQIDDYDLVHLFNLASVDTYIIWNRMRRKEVPMVLSTVYWPQNEYLAQGLGPKGILDADYIVSRIMRSSVLSGFVGVAKDLSRNAEEREVARMRRRVGDSGLKRKIIDSCRFVLPNSVAEAEVLKSEFSVLQEKIVVVHNGVSDVFHEHGSSELDLPFDRGEFVLSVARIESRKNVLRLIEACEVIRTPLVLVGSYDANDGYFRSCKRRAKKGRVLFYGPLPPESASLVSAYSAAGVHALVSWYETPGLSNLEAAAVGCAIVSTDRGSAREYFGNSAYYSDPTSTQTICDSLEMAFRDKDGPAKRQSLAQLIRTKFNWRNAGKKTLECYERALEKS
jgi:glycosyltransferase involved in cell wall biosynthesis